MPAKKGKKKPASPAQLRARKRFKEMSDIAKALRLKNPNMSVPTSMKRASALLKKRKK